MLTIMTNVAMNNKAGVIGGVAAMLIITLSIPRVVRQFCTCLLEFLKLYGSFCSNFVNYDIDRITEHFTEKKNNVYKYNINQLTIVF